MAAASQLSVARSALSDGEEVAFLRALVTFAKGNGGAPALYRTDAKKVLPPPQPDASGEAPTQTLLRAMWRVFAAQGQKGSYSSDSAGEASRQIHSAAAIGAEGAWLGKPLHRFPVTATLRPALVRLLSSAVGSAWKRDRARLGSSFAKEAADLALSLDPVAQSLVVSAMDLAPGHVPRDHLLNLAREAVLDGDHKTAALLTRSHKLGPEHVPADWVSSVWSSVLSRGGAKSPIARGVSQSAPPASSAGDTLGRIVIDLSLIGNDYQQAVGVAEQVPDLGRHLVNVLAGGGQDKLARRAMKRCGLERDPALSHIQDQRDATTLLWMLRSGLDEELIGNFLATRPQHIGIALRMASKQADQGEAVAAYRIALACEQALGGPAGAEGAPEQRGPGRRVEGSVRALVRSLQARGADAELERIERAQRPPRWVGDSPDPVVCTGGRWVRAKAGESGSSGGGGGVPTLAGWDPSQHLLSHLLIAGDSGGGARGEGEGEGEVEGGPLALPPGTSVYAVEDEEGMAYAADALARAGVFGFDSEWAPGVAGDDPLACDLLQFGTSDEVFLVDTHRLFRASSRPTSAAAAADWPPTHATEATAQGVAERLLSVFDPSFGATPLAFAPAEDFRTIRNLHPALASLSPPEHMVDLAQWRERARRFQGGHLLARPVAETAPASLAQMVERVLGRQLDKGPRLSNWARRPLRPSQAAYAALDAAVLVQLYARLKQL